MEKEYVRKCNINTAKKEYENGQFDEWEHIEDLNRLSFGLAIMFR